jgi:hypothetical protein
MAKAKNVPIDKERTVESPSYQPSQREMDVVGAVFTKFRNSADDRNRNFEYFDGINLIEYIEDSVRRFVTNVDERDDIEDWQARVHDPFTRNKVLAILGKVVRVLPMAQFVGRGDEDFRRAIVLTNLYEYAEDVDDYEELMVNILLEAIVKGTAIGYEGITRVEKQVRDIYKSGDELTFKKTNIYEHRLTGSIIPLEEFYPQAVNLRTIKQMTYCFWRKVIPYQKFIEDWGYYAQSKNVRALRQTDAGLDQKPFYVDNTSSDVADGNVEVICYYNKDTDEYVIVANGVWLNPISLKEGAEWEVSPLPFNHKELPFWDVKFDFFGSDFFYGKSLPDRLKSMQDVLNVLTNMLLDQSFLTIFPPLLTNGFDSLEDDYLRPGRRVPIDTQGLPINQAFMKLDLGTPSGWHQYILEYTRKIMEQSSVDQVSSGQAGVGGRTTAAEIRTAADGVASMLDLFGRMVNYGIKRKALLKGANILQVWTDPSTPMIQRVLGDEGNKDVNEAFNTFKIDSATLTSGKRGSKIIEMYKSKDDMPTKSTLKARAAIAKKNTGRNVEIIAIEGDYIRNLQTDIKVVANPKQPATKDIEKAIQLEKVRVYLSFFPEGVDKQELAAQTAEKMGDDPTKIFKKDWLIPMPQGGAENPEAMKTMGTEPESNIANNMARGAMGGEVDSMALRDLQESMMG